MNLTFVDTGLVVVGVPSLFRVLVGNIVKTASPGHIHGVGKFAGSWCITKIIGVHPIPTIRNYVPDLFKVGVPRASDANTPKRPSIMVVVHTGPEAHVVFTVGSPCPGKKCVPIFLAPDRHNEIAFY